jgi:transcriptional/translational regulatory protein YebC/TACO1
MFDRVGLITFPGDITSADEMLEAAIESGAIDVESSSEEHNVFCMDDDLNNVSNALELQFGESMSSKLIWKPQTTTELGLEEAEKILKLVDALEDDDDVQNVTANFNVSEDTLNLL